LKILDLFSGIGGFSLGLERAGMETAAFCEIDPFCREVLKKHWPDVPIYEDVRKLKGGEIAADIICGGYPCQPFSFAGKRKGKEDDRHLWPEVARLLSEVKPRWFIGENVAGHISMGLDEVLSDLEGQGYDAQTFVIPACAVDAKHRRDRVWIVAHSINSRYRGEIGRFDETEIGISQENWEKWRGGWMPFGTSNLERDGRTDRVYDGGEVISNTIGKGLQRSKEARNNGLDGEKPSDKQPAGCSGVQGRTWPPEPSVGRVANGIPRRMDRLRALGNAVVPQIPEMIGRAIMEIELAQG
jgi:DNA (cytosine-5)-methyltransferase 1